MRTEGCVSDRLVCCKKNLQGYVLAPFLFPLYSADFSLNSPGYHLQKFCDNFAIDSFIIGEENSEYSQWTQNLWTPATLREPKGACDRFLQAQTQHTDRWTSMEGLWNPSIDASSIKSQHWSSLGCIVCTWSPFFDFLVAPAFLYGVLQWSSSLCTFERILIDKLA